MLGVAPDRRGLLPDADVKRLEEFGAAIRKRYGKSVIMESHIRTHNATEAALDGDPGTFWSAPEGSHHAVLEVSFPKPVTFDRALTMEWLNDGQHVEKYRIEVWRGNSWKTVVQAGAIGHEKIDVFPAVIAASRVRLDILSSTGAAHIREFQLFNTGSGN